MKLSSRRKLVRVNRLQQQPRRAQPQQQQRFSEEYDHDDHDANDEEEEDGEGQYDRRKHSSSSSRHHPDQRPLARRTIPTQQRARLLAFFAVPLCFFVGRMIRANLNALTAVVTSDHVFTWVPYSSLSSTLTMTSTSKNVLPPPPLRTNSKNNKNWQQRRHSTTTSHYQNRARIRDILISQKETWGKFETLQGLHLQQQQQQQEQPSSTVVDITQNVPRVEDFLEQQDSTTATLKRKKNLETNNVETTEHDNNNNADPQKKEQSEPLNIVLFYADDWTMKVLGALNPHVQTPHIDAMAKQGVLFTRNCVTTSICWISRATLATGVYASIHQNLELTSTAMFDVSLPWLQTLYPLLKQHGYYTGLVGKWHALKPKPFISQAFHVIKNYYNKHWFTRNGTRRHVTDLNEEDALEFLRNRPKHKKFALTVSFFATHAWEGADPPYQPMEHSKQLYVNDTIPRPKTASSERYWNQLPWFFTETNMGRQRWRNRFDTPQNYQQNIKNLYRMATEVDTAVGRIIEELKRQGIYQTTLLIFTTDNGNLHGEHGLAEKWYPFEESIRVPLVIQDPRMPNHHKGTRNDEFTLSIDLAPTLLSAAGISIPSFMQGRDIAQLYLNNNDNNNKEEESSQTNWRQDFFYEWNQGNPLDAAGHHALSRNVPAVFALIRKDYKYFFWPESNYEQLFRIEADVYEEADIRNSTAQTTHQALLLMRVRYQFLKQWVQAGNPV